MALDITQNVTPDVYNLAPSANAVYQALQDKATLDLSNNFQSANYFPDVNISVVPSSQIKLAVNVNSVKKYVTESLNGLYIKVAREFLSGGDSDVEAKFDKLEVASTSYNSRLLLTNIVYKTGQYKYIYYNSDDNISSISYHDVSGAVLQTLTLEYTTTKQFISSTIS